MQKTASKSGEDAVRFRFYKEQSRVQRAASLILAVFLLLGTAAGFSGCKAEEAVFSSKEDAGERSGKEETLLGAAEVHFIDVGQGDSTLIIADDEAMLIDCGDNEKGSALRYYLEQQGIEELEYVIGTHPDADHIGGMDVILYHFYCEQVFLPDYEVDTKTYDDVIQTARNKNYSITCPEVAETYSLGKGEFTVIAPNDSDYGDNTNDYSIGLIFHYGDTSFVFTGDAEEAEKDIANNGIDLSADVFKAGHHGSSNASSSQILDAVNPRYAVISCGEDNRYGHPHNETLERFRTRGIEVYRTDLQGTIIAYTDGERLWWSEEKSDFEPEDSKNGAGGQGAWNSAEKNQETEVSETYILNTNTKKYHLPDCSSAAKIAEKNKAASSASTQELEAQGYEPCGNCLRR